MARPKGAKNKTVVKKHVFKDPMVEEIVEMEIEVKDPLTGKMIKQKVKVKRLKRVVYEQKAFVGAQSIIDDLEKDDSNIVNSESED